MGLAEQAKVRLPETSKILVFGNKSLELNSNGGSAIKYYGEAKDLRITNKSITRGDE